MREAAAFIAHQSEPIGLGGVLHALLTPVRWWRRRRKLLRLLDLDDYLLTDIGVTREDVRYAFDLPLSVDASLELEDRAFRRGRREAQPKWRRL